MTMWTCSLFLSLLMMLPFTTPEYGVKVERDVAYSTAPGYWTHAPVGDNKAIAKLMFHSGKTETGVSWIVKGILLQAHFRMPG